MYQPSSAEQFDKLYAYHRAVADAAVKLTGAEGEICAEWQQSTSEAHRQFLEEDHQSGWQHWKSVHRAAVRLREAHEDGKGIAQAYEDYCQALATFGRARSDDRLSLHAQLAESLSAALWKAQDGHRESYSEYLEAVKSAAEPVSKPAKAAASGKSQKKSAES